MNPILAGQIRHGLTLAGGAAAGSGVAGDSLEAIVGGLVIAAVGQAWSWLSKRAR